MSTCRIDFTQFSEWAENYAQKKKQVAVDSFNGVQPHERDIYLRDQRNRRVRECIAAAASRGESIDVLRSSGTGIPARLRVAVAAFNDLALPCDDEDDGKNSGFWQICRLGQEGRQQCAFFILCHGAVDGLLEYLVRHHLPEIAAHLAAAGVPGDAAAWLVSGRAVSYETGAAIWAWEDARGRSTSTKKRRRRE